MLNKSDIKLDRNILARWFKHAKEWFLDEKIQGNCYAVLPHLETQKGLIIFCNKEILEETMQKIHNLIFEE